MFQQPFGQHAEYQFFPEEYFSGSDVSIYFGDIWIDEIVALEVSVVEAVQPVFGFQSYVYDAVMRGSRQVSGSLVIPFKESNWLKRVLQAERERRKQQDLSPYHWHPATRSSSDRALLEQEASRFIEDAQGIGIEELRRRAKELQRQMWGSETRASTQRKSAMFQSDDPEGFTIVIVAGDPVADGRGMMGHHALSSISGVQIVSASRAMDSGGEPIYEQYSFVARDIDGDVFNVGEEQERIERKLDALRAR